MPLWSIAALAAFFIKGLCGFANTLIFNTILSFTSDNINISPIELLLGYPTNAIMAWRGRREINWHICLPISALVLAGSIVGAFFLKNIDARIVKTAFGAIIILLGIEMLLRESSTVKYRPSGALMTCIGLLSGLLCGLYGVGALLGAYMSRVYDDSRSFKANLCMVFFIENTLRIAMYAAYGILTIDALIGALKLAPFMLIGLFGGIACTRFLPEKAIKRVVIIMLIISGAALIINSI